MERRKPMNNNERLEEIILSAFSHGVIKKLVFSQPKESEIQKISGRLCAHRGKNIISLEYFLPGNTVSHKNLDEAGLSDILPELIDAYRQVNLITTLGECEYRITKSGNTALLGAEKLKNKLSGSTPAFEAAVGALDNKKNYILNGSESFLTALGVSDKNGRVHDKKQGKFRQINRFLEYIEELYCELPQDREILIYDLCCGKSYLSFAVYYYLTEIKGRNVRLLGIDLKRDVIEWCSRLANTLGFSGMTFIYDDVKNTPVGEVPDMVISLHACDVATDIVLDRGMALGARVILSTPCCHRYLNKKIKARELEFVTRHSHLSVKLCEALTDAIRLARLEANGYKVMATELTDPENTPKNTLLRAIKKENAASKEKEAALARYESILEYLLGDGKDEYLKEIK